jgi:TRAP-type C4-dicarboxylate transport system permease small subunit
VENADDPSSPNQNSQSENLGWATKSHAIWASTENWLISTALGVMMALPLLEIALRRFNSGVSGSAEMLQHLVLFVAMAGGAIAARENRLLSLSTFAAFLKGPWATAARSFSASVSVFVTFAIGIGCYQFINTGGIGDEVLFFGVPVWVFMAVMPVGFALLGLRIIWFSGSSWYLRLIPVMAGVALYFFVRIPLKTLRDLFGR